MVADGDNGQSQTSTAGDVSAAVPITVLTPALVATGASASQNSAILGSTISVSWTVQNEGSAVPSGTTWFDGVYISSATTLDSSATFVTDFYEGSNAPLASGGVYSDTENITLPATATGPRYLLFVPNDGGYLSEDTTANTVFALPITLSAPDLAVTQATAPAAAVAGATIPISWTVQNQGTVEAPAQWSDAVFLSPDDVFDSNAKLISYFQAPPPPLAAGAGYTESENIVLPLTYTGPEYLLFIADADGGQPESNSANNVYALPIDISAAELTVSSVTAPPTAILGQPLTVSWTVENIDAGPADEQWSDGVYYSATNTFNSSAELLTSVPVGSNSPLAAGGSYTQSTQVTLPSGLAAGTYYILVYTDVNGQQPVTDASDETAASGPVAVTGADLIVSSATAPANANFGQTIGVTWTVLNTGAGCRQPELDGRHLFLGLPRVRWAQPL